MNETLEEIESITFGVTSPQHIKEVSVCKIDSTKMVQEPGTVYDPAMGPCFDIVTKCVTCKENAKVCTGHFGYIELNYPVVHPLYPKSVAQYLKCFCSHCHRLLITKEHIDLNGLNKYKGSARFTKIIEKLEKVDICCHCKHTQPTHSYSQPCGTFSQSYTAKDEDGKKKTVTIVLNTDEILHIFDNVLDDDIKLLGIDPRHVHPKNLILIYLPVIPSCARPPVIADGNISDDDLTTQYIEIIKKNNDLANYTDDLTEKFTEILSDLEFHIGVLFDNSKGQSKHNANNKEKNTFKGRLSGKGGLLRNNLMGKRVDQSARTVIGPDPTLKINEIGVPQHIADTLTVPVHVTSFNIDKLMKLVNEEDGANFITNLKGAMINLGFALYRKGTQLLFGDIVIRGDKKIPVQTMTVDLHHGDLIERQGQILDKVEYPQKRCYRLQIGEIVHRKLQKGDILLLNRQPTLHQGSMMGMRVVPRRGPGSQKTITMNLAVTKSFNADFDNSSADF
jgi:DNA-directed RNA polymerase beta' subunit